MRIGQNPSKNEKVQESFFYHQVIVPVYISKDLDYFKDALSILKYSLESLIISSHQHTFITVVDNGSDEFTKQYLRSLFHSGKIHELIHTNKIGKVNAILKGLVGHNFKLITIADADVLFDAKWQSETYKVFNAFPKAGVICPTPSSKSFRTLTANVWFDLLFSKKLRFQNPIDPASLKAFARSLDNENFYNQAHLENILTITNNGTSAVVGAGHYVATYRSEIFNSLPGKHSDLRLGGKSIRPFLDLPVVRRGFWRVSTAGNYAWHMGNVLEDWMENHFLKMQAPEQNILCPALPPLNSSAPANWLKNVVFAKVIERRSVMSLLLRLKGLSAGDTKRYF